MFSLHPQLENDTHLIGDLPLCHVLLMNNAHFPWLILVPRRTHLKELFDLSSEDYTQCMQEIRMVSEKFCAFTKADKINVAALGSMVPQLHVHIIARYKSDKAWPNPVWNSGVAPIPYEESALLAILADLKKMLLPTN